MTDRAKQIEEMAIGFCEYGKARGHKKCDDCDWGGECGVTEYARALYDAGYRKQIEVVKEFVAGVTVELNKRRDSELYGKDSILGIINKVAAEYGVEVEK